MKTFNKVKQIVTRYVEHGGLTMTIDHMGRTRVINSTRPDDRSKEERARVLALREEVKAAYLSGKLEFKLEALTTESFV